MLFDSILPTVELLSKLESAFSNHAAALSIKFRQYSKSFVVISTTTFTVSSPAVDSISRYHLLCSSIRSNSSPVTSLWDCSNSVTYSGSDSSSHAIFNTLAVTSSNEVLNPSKSLMRIGINFFQIPANVDIWTSFHEPWMFLLLFSY